MIRIYIIEDHLTVMLSSWRFLFRPKRDSIIIAGFSPNVDDAICKADPLCFDVIILDLHIPDYKPIENIRKLKQRFPDKPIMIYTYEKSSSWKAKMFHEGAHAYLTKDVTREELKIVLHKVSKGEPYNPVYFDDKDNSIEFDKDKGSIVLTPLQTEIVRLLSDGYTHKEISDKSGISRSQLEKILRNLRSLYKMKNNVALIKFLSQKGII